MKLPKSILVVVIIGSLIVGITQYHIFFSSKRDHQEAGALLKSVLEGQTIPDQEDKPVVEVLAKAFENNKKLLSSIVKLDIALQEKNLNDPSSYETKENMQEIVGLLDELINELKGIEKKEEKALATTESIIAKSGLSDAEKEDMKEAVRQSWDESLSLRRSYYSAYLSLAQGQKDLYQFLLDNFDKYVVDFDDYYEKNIYFDDDATLDSFDRKALIVDGLVDEFFKARQVYAQYVNRRTGQFGVDFEDLEKYYNTL